MTMEKENTYWILMIFFLTFLPIKGNSKTNIKEGLSWNICLSGRAFQMNFGFFENFWTIWNIPMTFPCFCREAPSTLTRHVKTRLGGWKGSSYQTFIHFSIQFLPRQNFKRITTRESSLSTSEPALQNKGRSI